MKIWLRSGTDLWTRTWGGKNVSFLVYFSRCSFKREREKKNILDPILRNTLLDGRGFEGWVKKVKG